MVALDRRSPLPLWAQLVDDLRHRVAASEFDGHFPTDAELSKSYDVSRHTVREAVRHLEAENLIVRGRGRLTVVQPLLEQPLDSLYSFSSSLRAQGLSERSTVRVCERRRAPAEAAEELGVGEGTEVLYLERVRLADDEPMAWDRSWLPIERAECLLGLDLSGGGLYEALATHCGLRVTGGWERIRPVIPRSEERRLLAMPAEVAAFSIERLVVADEYRVEWRRSLIRGDRYRLSVQWPAGVPTRL